MKAGFGTRRVMSLDDVDSATLSEIARACNVPESSIQDIYNCTPLQSSMIAANRDEMFHFVLSSTRPVDPDPFCDALRRVVAHNTILRTRIVECADLGALNVVTNEDHVTDRDTGYSTISDYLRVDDNAPHHRFGAGQILFRSAYVEQSFVVTIHHAVMDYWSIDKLLKIDTPVVYAAQPIVQRPPFKDFVLGCLNADEATAKAFWTPRFKGSPAVFPAATLSQEPCQHKRPLVVEKPTRNMILAGPGGRAAAALTHMPLFIEAAWALTASIYTDSESVAYGYVLSGRSVALNGTENTLGPTITEVPVQVNGLRRQTMTVDRLIKDRATALRQLQQNAAVTQYGLENIGAVSEAARAAAGFTTLVNIRPAVFKDVAFATTTEDDAIKLHTVWLRGYYALQLIFSITEAGVTVWPRVDSAVVGDGQLGQILNQFEHNLRLLTDAPLHTRLCDLPLLDPHARQSIFGWNKLMSVALDKRLIPEIWNGADAQSQETEGVVKEDTAAIPASWHDRPYHPGRPAACAVWIANPDNVDDLAPLGGVGEVIIEVPDAAPARETSRAVRTEMKASQPLYISEPKWACLRGSEGAIVSLVGRVTNRIRLGGKVIQLEQIERVLLRCDQVRDAVVIPRIVRGRTQLVAVVCLAEARFPRAGVLLELPGHDVDPCRRLVSAWAQSKLPQELVPSFYHVVEELPRSPSQVVERAIVREWLKGL
ncbi:nonribosomal peptide synthase [Colletotrichum tofieldiae]|nr:nonribosomal peptide synthase [Colletotrichum tofieldiae]